MGLSIGIAASLLLLRYVAHERSYDTFHTNAKNIYRLQHDTYKAGVLENQSAITYHGAGPEIKATFSDVKNFVRLHRADGMYNYYKHGVEVISYYETKAYYADSSFFEIFDFPLVSGNRKTILRSPTSLAISESAARKYFGAENPIGKTLVLEAWEKGEFQVEAVFKDVPENSHMKFDFIVSIQNLLNNGQFRSRAWYWVNFYTYLQLQDEADPEVLEKKFSTIIDKHLGSHLRKINSEEIFTLQPLTDIHLHSNLFSEMEPNGDFMVVSFLLIISFFILGIAWLNYVNLSIAKAAEKTKEVGIRKVAGSSRGQLIKQFLTESVLLIMVSIVVGMTLFIASSNTLESLADKEITSDVFQQINFWMLSLCIIIIGSFLAGLYPALVISSFDPIKAIKGKFIGSSGAFITRKALVIFQFSAGILLIMATVIVSMQLDFMRKQDLGFDIKQKLVVRAPRIVKSDSYLNSMDLFKTSAMAHPDVVAITASSDIPGKEIFSTNEYRLVSEPENVRRLTHILAVDEEFIPTYNITLAAGRNFERDRSSDYGEAAIINEAALKQLGFKDGEDVLGQRLLIGNEFNTVIGVIKDFHQRSLKEVTDPIIIVYVPWRLDYLTFDITSSNTRQTVEAIKASYEEVFPDNAFDYFFLDDTFNKQYQGEERAWKIFMLFSGLAIFVACVGLLGLSSLMSVQRAREVAIRKVHGASVANLTTLLASDFVKLVLTALVIATPISWYVMDVWLQNFAYRVSVPWWAFIFVGMLTVAVALIAVIFPTMRTAFANPANVMKVE